jgi:hypothetical protein
MEQVKTSWGDKARIIIYGDMWDSEANDNADLITYLSHAGKTGITAEIFSLPGLSGKQRKEFRENVVLMPWNYNGESKAGDKDYDASVTFARLAGNGFRFVYGHEITPKNRFPYPPKNKAQAEEYIAQSRNHQSSCLGFAALHWCEWPSRCFDSIEFLSVGNKGFVLEEK